MVVTLPLVMLLLDVWPLGRSSAADGAAGEARSQRGDRSWKLLFEKLPWFALAGAGAAITVLAQRAGGSLDATDVVPLAHRVANAVVSYVRYLGMLVWPSKLCVLYPHPDLAGGTPWSAWQVGLAASTLVVLTVGAFELGRRQRYVAVGWLWYLVTLAPVIGVVQVGQQAMADRYTYLPYVGPFVIVAWGGAAIASSPAFGPRRVRAALAGLTLAVVVAFSLVAWRQVGYWRNTITLFERTLAVTRPAPIVLTNLGAALAEQGRLDEAVAMHGRALEIAPNDVRALNNLGFALQLQGKLDEAVRCYRQALDIAPDALAPRHNLATALRDAGHLDEAIAQYRQALLLHPDAVSTREALAEALRRAGRPGAPGPSD